MAYNIGGQGGYAKPLGRFQGGANQGPKLIATALTATAASSGVTLTCVKGAWQGWRATSGFQWYRSAGGTIVNATNSTLQVSNSESGKTLTCQVWATNAYGKYVNNEARLAILLP